jgi:type IV pilus assembly protein PilQ
MKPVTVFIHKSLFCWYLMGLFLFFSATINAAPKLTTFDNGAKESISSSKPQTSQPVIAEMPFVDQEGKLLSFNFQNIPVRNVLQIIADAQNFNLVTTDAVTGNITLHLDNVPWDQALDAILTLKGLGKQIQGNVLMVAPLDDLANQQDKNNKIETKTMPLVAEFIQLNYAKAADIAVILSAEKSSLLSKAGNVSVDPRTNTLLIKETAAVIKSILNLVAILDVPVRQVIIEARMVTINNSAAEKLGVQWGASGNVGTFSSSGTLSGISGGIEGDIANRLSVNLPVVGAAGNLAFQVAKFADGQILDLQLSALEQENKAEIIATPRITTLNQQTAYIEQGTEIPYVESSSSGATSVSFKKAVLSLEVTPQITPDNNVILDLVITQDSKGDTVSTSTGDAIAINTQEIATQVLVENGETLVLGGIYQQQVTHFTTKVPLLGDIPYLGYLFRSTTQENSKAELLIFVTPRIVTQAKY